MSRRVKRTLKRKQRGGAQEETNLKKPQTRIKDLKIIFSQIIVIKVVQQTCL